MRRLSLVKVQLVTSWKLQYNFFVNHQLLLFFNTSEMSWFNPFCNRVLSSYVNKASSEWQSQSHNPKVAQGHRPQGQGRHLVAHCPWPRFQSYPSLTRTKVTCPPVYINKKYVLWNAGICLIASKVGHVTLATPPFGDIHHPQYTTSSNASNRENTKSLASAVKKSDFWALGPLGLLIFHHSAKFGAKMLIDAEIMAENRNPRWRPSAILDLLRHHIGPPTDQQLQVLMNSRLGSSG